MIKGLEKQRKIFNAAEELQRAMEDVNGAKYDKAAIQLRTIAGRMMRYYCVRDIPKYQKQRVDNGVVFPKPANLVGMLSDYQSVDENICQWLSHAVNEGNNAAHPDNEIPVDMAIVDSIYKKMDDIIEKFLTDFPSDEEYIDPLRGSVTIRYKPNFYDKTRHVSYPVLEPICILENSNFSVAKINWPRLDYNWYVDGKRVDRKKYLELKDKFKSKTIVCVVESRQNDGSIKSEEYIYDDNCKLDGKNRANKNSLVKKQKSIEKSVGTVLPLEKKEEEPSPNQNTSKKPIETIEPVEDKQNHDQESGEINSGTVLPAEKTTSVKPNIPKKKPLFTADEIRAKLAKDRTKTQEDFDAEGRN